MLDIFANLPDEGGFLSVVVGEDGQVYLRNTDQVE